MHTYTHTYIHRYIYIDIVYSIYIDIYVYIYYKTQKYNINTRNMVPTAAAFMYIDLRFSNLASFLYFCDIIERFCVFVSSSGIIYTL